MNDKIIFLDFDGVFILDDIINETCIVNINNIINKTSAKIVVSSDWKNQHTIEELKILFKKWNIKGEIIGVTDNLWPEGGSLSMIEKYRCNEINKYISEFDITNYVIIDDLELYNGFYTEKNENFFNTLFYKGLTLEISEKIIKTLNI